MMGGFRRISALVLFAAILAGCAGVPFKSAEKAEIPAGDPWAVCSVFGGKNPDKFSLLNTIEFNYGWFSRMSAIGAIELDGPGDRFVAACFTPLGIKLFEVGYSAGKLEPRYVFKQLAEKGDVARAVGEDIKKIYFDMLPAPGAAVKAGKYSLVFEGKRGDGVIRHIFAGPGANLVEKCFYGANGRLSWKVSYYEYETVNGKVFPGGIVLENVKYGYTLTVRLKKVNE